MLVVTLTAHPVDSWTLCGGTLTRLARETDSELHVISLCSQNEESQSLAAAELLEIRYHSLGQAPMRLFFSDERVERVTGLLRDLKPDVVLTHHPADSIPDHQVTSQIVQAACLASACPSYQMTTGGLPLSKIPHLYFCDPTQGVDVYGRSPAAGICVDISHFVEVKAELLSHYASRSDEEQALGGYPSCSERWLELSQIRGATIGAQNAEGFTQCRGVGFPSEDVLGTVLGCWPAEPV